MDKQMIHILLVEDEDAHVKLVRRSFESHANLIRLTVAGSLKEARICLAESLPDLVIADLVLPDGRGIELLPAEDEERLFPLVVMTSYGDEQIAVEAMKAGALDYVVKSATTLADMPHIAERALREWSHIIERKKMEAELQNIDKLESIGALAGGIAHDFNNLLTGIVGNISLAKMYSSEEKVIERLTEAERASMQSRHLTQQLLTFSKGGAPVKETASISELLKDTTQFALSGSNVKSLFSIPDDLWQVKIDKRQISQVIQNLVANADQAMPIGGVIKIRAENVIISDKDNLPISEGKYIKISVSDEGIGISKEYLTKIFDPYFTTKAKGSEKGTGLGLTICHSIIEKHSGYITVESEVEIGTTFYIYLPTFQREVSEEVEVKERIFSGTGRILVMDDEEIVRKVTGDVLNHLGYNVDFACDGSEAIELYQKAKESGNPFDAVILDLTIPGGMGGKKAVEKLFEIDPEVKAIVSSGYSTDPIMSDYKQYGFSEAVAKPYNIKELGEILHRVI